MEQIVSLIVFLLELLSNGDIVKVMLSAMSIAHSVSLTYNAALNKPSFQSSVFVSANFPGEWGASLANDGNLETIANKDNKPWCSASLIETNPWWAVDLGRPTTIYRVSSPTGVTLQRQACTV